MNNIYFTAPADYNEELDKLLVAAQLLYRHTSDGNTTDWEISTSKWPVDTAPQRAFNLCIGICVVTTSARVSFNVLPKQ